MGYNWQLKDWPKFIFDSSKIESVALEFAMETGVVKGMIEGLSEENQQEAILQFMIDEAIKSSGIEGEYHSRQDIKSSIQNRLGLYKSSIPIRDIKARGIAELMVDVRENYAKALSESLIKNWHETLFSNARFIKAGSYRTSNEPMLIVSGSIGKEEVHYQAPASVDVPKEMKHFVAWYNSYTTVSHNVKESLIKTSIAHLYFESIHPFEDGNGRIGRAIADKCLSESLGRPLVLSISTTIEQDKNAYYSALKQAQKTLNITEWIVYFSQIILNAQIQAKKSIRFILEKASFLDKYRTVLNNRQLKVVLKMLEYGLEGFEGGMTARKYISITKTSKATATRDLQDMVHKSCLTQIGAGRSVRYELNM